MSPRAVPGRPVLVWVLLIPIVYAPPFLVGDRPGPAAFGALAGSLALAALAWLLLSRTRALDRAAAGLDRVAPHLLAVVMAAHFLYSMVQAQQRLAAFADFNQLGLFSQSTWTLLRGHPFANTHETLDGSLGSHFGIHFSPTLLLAAPVYALFPNPIVLLGLQALALSLIPLPLFHLLRERAGAGPALVLSLAALAIPSFALGGPLDFRDQSLLPVLLLATVWAMEERRPRWLLAFSVLALGVREDTGLTFVALGPYALIRGLGVRVALGVALLGVVWFATVTQIVIPHFWTPGLWMDPRKFFVNVLGHWGETPLAALQGMLGRPGDVARAIANGESLRYLYALFAPLLLLPPFGDAAVLVALPSLALNLLSRLPFMRDVSQGYSLAPLTFLALATALLAVRVAHSALPARRAASALALALVVLAGALPALAIGLGRPEQPAPPPEAARRVVDLIPEGAPIYAPVALYPALCNRKEFGCWWSTYERGRDPDFRARYEWIVVWPQSDAPGAPREAALAESLATDRRFVEHQGFAPFVVYQRQ